MLDNTGTAAANGGLVVSGTGAAGSGGIIQHKTGANGLTTAGIGIYLNQKKGASFSWMQLNDFDNFAIRGNQVNGLTLSNVVVSGLNGNDAGSDEGSVFLDEASATITITCSNVSGGFEDNLRVLYDDAAAQTATFNVTGSTFRDLQAAGQNSQVNLRSATSASSASNVTFNFTGSNVFRTTPTHFRQVAPRTGPTASLSPSRGHSNTLSTFRTRHSTTSSKGWTSPATSPPTSTTRS